MRKVFGVALGLTLGGAFPALAQEAAESGPLTVEGGLVIWTLVVFGLLLLILGRSAWPVLLQAVRDRERELERRLAEAAKAQEEAARLLEEHKKLLAGGKADAQALINEAKVIAQKEREALLHKTREEQEQMLERAKREIEMERERAVMALRREAVDLSLAAATKLIQERLDDDTNRKLVTQYLGSLEIKH
jgi:F-type H+-transporting ATPase subunit b